MKEEFIKLLKDIDRPGMDKLLEFLEKSDFSQRLQAQDFMDQEKVD